MSIIGLSMAVLPCRAEEDVEAGSAALRVDWPVYPRRAEHNTVAEGGNRKMGRDCASELVPIALAEGRPEDPRAKASAEIDVAAVTVEGSPHRGPEPPRAMGRRRAVPPRD